MKAAILCFPCVNDEKPQYRSAHRRLVTDPESEFAKNREELEHDAPGTFKNSLDKIYESIQGTNIKM